MGADLSALGRGVNEMFGVRFDLGFWMSMRALFELGSCLAYSVFDGAANCWLGTAANLLWTQTKSKAFLRFYEKDSSSSAY